MSELLPLHAAPRGHVPEVRSAYRLLRGTHQTVRGLFDAVSVLDDQRRLANPNKKGRMTRDEVDILRSAIVLTSSGLDASMKRLVNDAGRRLIAIPGTGARAQYEQYLKRALSGPAVPDGIRNAVVSADPGSALLEYYLGDRTRASMQGSGDLKARVRSVLGIPGTAVADIRLETLDYFFIARNKVVHDMDYKETLGGSVARVHRAPGVVALMCNRVFEVAAELVGATATVLKQARR
jgi:hypothetical protein